MPHGLLNTVAKCLLNWKLGAPQEEVEAHHKGYSYPVFLLSWLNHSDDIPVLKSRSIDLQVVHLVSFLQPSPNSVAILLVISEPLHRQLQTVVECIQESFLFCSMVEKVADSLNQDIGAVKHQLVRVAQTLLRFN